jgi:hypothetical protein
MAGISIHMSDSGESRFRELLLSFRIRNTLELDNGKCACLSCRTLFRSIEYLNMHFERCHALELQALKKRSQSSPVAPSATHGARPTDRSLASDAPRDSTDDLNALQRAERQAYLDFDQLED